jgi:hypothetical protein
MNSEKSSADGNGQRVLSENARRALSIMERIRTITPADLLNMSDEVRREVMIFLGIDPDEPLPEEIVRLINELHGQSDDEE